MPHEQTPSKADCEEQGILLLQVAGAPSTLDHALDASSRAPSRRRSSCKHSQQRTRAAPPTALQRAPPMLPTHPAANRNHSWAFTNSAAPHRQQEPPPCSFQSRFPALKLTPSKALGYTRDVSNQHRAASIPAFYRKISRSQNKVIQG